MILTVYLIQLLKRAKEMFFEPLAKLGVDVHMLAGNHDTYFKNTNDVNSVDLLLGEYASSFNIIDGPSEIYVGPHKVCMMPWICPENQEESMEMLKNTDAKFCMGHFEISGFAMYRGMPSEGGLDRGIFRNKLITFNNVIGFLVCGSLVAGSFYLSLNGAHRLIDTSETISVKADSTLSNKTAYEGITAPGHGAC